MIIKYLLVFITLFFTLSCGKKTNVKPGSDYKNIDFENTSDEDN